MNRKKIFMFVVFVLLSAMIFVACTPEEVEVTRVVTETETVTETITEEVEVTRIVEGEVVTEIEEVEVEVTRIVEVAAEEEMDEVDCDIVVEANENGSPVELNFIGWPFPLSDHFQAELSKCDGVENLDINKQILDNTSVFNQLNLTLAGGAESPYAIAQLSNARITGYVEGDYLMPLDDLIEKYSDQYDLDDIPAAAFDAATIDGKIYGIPWSNNTKHLVYRSDLFEQYGLEVPTTWDEIIDACGVLADEPSVDQVFTMNLHAGWAWELQFTNIARAFGMPNLVNADGTPAFNGPEGVAAVELMIRVIDACMGDEGLTYSIDDSQIGIQNGSLAFAHIWASRGSVMHDPENTDIADLIAFAPAAAAEEGGLLTAGAWNDYYGIPLNTTVDPEVAFLVMMEALDLESQSAAGTLGVVTRASAAEGGPDNAAATVASVAGGVGAYGKHPATSIAQVSVGNFLPLVASGDMTAQEALDAAAAEFITEATAAGILP